MNWPMGRVLAHHYGICYIDGLNEVRARMWEDVMGVYWRILEAGLLWSEGTRAVFLGYVGLDPRPLLGRQRTLTRCVECILFAPFIPAFVPCLPLNGSVRHRSCPLCDSD